MNGTRDSSLSRRLGGACERSIALFSYIPSNSIACLSSGKRSRIPAASELVIFDREANVLPSISD